MNFVHIEVSKGGTIRNYKVPHKIHFQVPDKCKD